MNHSLASHLPFLPGGREDVAQRGDYRINRRTFLAEIEELAQQLPDRPCLVNLCADRYRFTVAWAAAMLRNQITLLPAGRDAGSVRALLADYPALYLLTDDDDTDGLPDPRFAYPQLSGTGMGGLDPAFPADQIAAVLFTSGSTGRSNSSLRRWGRLVASSRAAGLALGIERYPDAAIIATVPHAHSYGLESAVMLPLQHRLLLTAERPFFPADVAAALMRCEHPGILVTTPVHLRALVGDAATAEPGPGLGAPVRAGFVLSATAPLSAELAARAETTFSAPVFEIYGCSEAGQVATRRTVEGPVWHCLDGLRLRQDEAGTWASGPDEADVLLADEIELHDTAGFILQGRTADTVNVAGKRSSLAYLTRQLLTIDGVDDGIFLIPDTGAAEAPSRLAAVVVAPGVDAATILAALRQRIDPAFLPRPLHVVAALPRNALGKLPRAEILRLVERKTDRPAPLVFRIPVDHPAGPGHFPGDPIVPGAVLLNELVATLYPSGWSGEIDAAKFHRPVRPGDTLAVMHRGDGESTRFECRLAGSDQLVLSGILRSSSRSR